MARKKDIKKKDKKPIIIMALALVFFTLVLLSIESYSSSTPKDTEVIVSKMKVEIPIDDIVLVTPLNDSMQDDSISNILNASSNQLWMFLIILTVMLLIAGNVLKGFRH